jgi:hypothetical protein
MARGAQLTLKHEVQQLRAALPRRGGRARGPAAQSASIVPWLTKQAQSLPGFKPEKLR